MDPNIVNSLEDVEKRSDLSTDEKVNRVIHTAAGVCAGIAVQPIPIADIFILTPTQAYFATRIARLRGVPTSEATASEVIRELLGVVGMGIAAQQVALAVWKLVTIGFGAVLTIPMVYGLTFAILKVADAYYVAKAEGRSLSKSEAKQVWKKSRAEAQTLATREKRELPQDTGVPTSVGGETGSQPH